MERKELIREITCLEDAIDLRGDMSANTNKLRIFVAEDEALIAMLLEDILLDLGHEVQVFSRVPAAVEAAKAGKFDLAILDVNLAGEPSYPIARILKERAIPFAFATGYGSGLDDEFACIPILPKPYLMEDVELVVGALVLPQPAERR